MLKLSPLFTILPMATLLPVSSYAAQDCHSITDDTERLACYDSLSRSMENPSLATDGQAADKQPDNFNLDEMSISGISHYFNQRELFRLTPHEPSYILPASYNDKPNEEVWQQLRPGSEMDNLEVKFQISGKIKLWDNLYKDNWDVWFGYTQTAWWQLYNSGESAPFRETNYSPEVFVSYYSNYDVFGFELIATDFGLIHQSNGRSEPLSRSWNRIYANFELTKGNFLLSIQPWYRLPEDADDDDNPDIDKYLGYGNYRLSYKSDGHLMSILLRNNFRTSDNKGGVELSWAFPVYETVKLYLQYYNGYGESLIDYDHYTNRISLGLLIYDWI
ncbi:phospholipase A [Photobacterium rosenbergii]|uniref:phospholipase A n=1 Tax=Photobacterium rosenbergii TaxID=294936 RepID=UPI001C99D239|nr:phospholipase A [Photobacterium rosenbergii]MBY5945906.1 phospholipase A [Photobacterium rosenbergii]